MHLGTPYKHAAFGILLVALAGWLTACGEVTGTPDPSFVALDSVFDEQVRLLASLEPEVKKWVRTEEGEEAKIFQNIDWQKELAAFRQADISKPGLRGAYTVEQVAPQVRVFRLKPGENAEVQELRIAFTDDNRIKSIQALINDENYLYHTRRTFRIQFASRNRYWVVDTYQVQGFQKLLWNDQKPFALRAKVL